MKTTPFLKTCLVSAALLTLTPWGHAQPPHKGHAHKTPPPKAGQASAGAWQPNTALLKQLAPEVTLGDYALRPPEGYESTVNTREGEKEMLSINHWASEKRADHSQADLWVFIGSPKPGFHPDNVDKQMEGFQDEIESHLQHRTQSSEEEGSVHGIPFTRIYWKGSDTDTPTKQLEQVHGFTYTAVDSFTIIVVIAVDTEPYSQTSLPLMEASVETLHAQQ